MAAMQIRDLEEKHKNLKEKLLLVGQNLIEFREKNMADFLEVKKEVKVLGQKVERLTSFLETVSSEFSKFAKKDDLNVLVKQAKMFQPLEFVTRQELEKLKK